MLRQKKKDEYNIREDEEQNVKLDEIIDLLVAAGYFRARIKGLSAFDKVIGGMVWCMESCSFDVNVDLLFQENSTIGQKIALTEKIVTVLSKMECPHMIEPHQIQGLDFIHVYPVIQWLVKRSVKVREERRDFIRHHAVQQFDKAYSSVNHCNKHVVQNLRKVQNYYRRQRSFKRKYIFPEVKELRVQSTLLEYGFPNRPIDADNKGCSQASFAETCDQEEFVPLRMMGNIVHLQVQKIAQVSKQFAKLKMDVQGSNSSLTRIQKDIVLYNKNSLFSDKEELGREIELQGRNLLHIQQKLKQFNENKIASENENHFRIYEKIQGLMLLEDHIKKQEQQFRHHCKTELQRLQQLVQEATVRNESEEGFVSEHECDEEKEKVQGRRLQIAKKNRSIAFLQRQLDEIPGRGELTQYQRRFLELYSQVAKKHEETKQFYTMYNTLADTKLYLSKELSLLNSVLDNYSEAMSNATDKEEFMRQFESIVAAIKQNKQKVEKRKGDERSRRDKLSKQVLDLVEQQRNYVTIVKQLRSECKKNERLLAYFRGQT